MFATMVIIAPIATYLIPLIVLSESLNQKEKLK
jgi:hypothetical protein